MRTYILILCLFGISLCSCTDDIHKGYRAPGYDQVLEKQRIINNTKAVKSINSYDDLGCEIYDIPKKEQVRHLLIMNWVMIKKKVRAVLS